MTDFVEYLLYLLERGLLLAAAAVVLGAVILTVVYRRHQKKYRGERKFPWGRAIGLLALTGYLAVVLLVTVLRSSGGRGVNLHLGLAWREAWNQFTLKLWLNIILNIGLFVPLGILLPLLWKKFRKWHWTLLAGFGLSLAIELAQMVRGNLTDVDDLLHNTLGAMLGWCAVMLVLHLWAKKPKRAAACLILPGAVAAVFGGVFLAYEWQEFGNLEFAPTFRANTKDVAWSLECTLEGTDTAPVYHVEPFDKESADAFGTAFFERIGRECPDVYYYDNLTILGNHSGGPFLNINWLDRTWDVTGFEFPEVLREVDEAEMRSELEVLGVETPAGAVFEDLGDSKARLTADLVREGDTLYNGYIQRRVDESGEYWLDYSLVVCDLYREADILTPEEAYEKLFRGDFYHGDWISHYGIRTVSVTDWELRYMVDSKGFYQPVYFFTLESEQTEYPYEAIIPAIS